MHKNKNKNSQKQKNIVSFYCLINYIMEYLQNITIPTDYAAIFIFAYALATIITYKLMKGAKEADRKIF